jgi:hypothetical protein
LKNGELNKNATGFRKVRPRFSLGNFGYFSVSLFYKLMSVSNRLKCLITFNRPNIRAAGGAVIYQIAA